MPRFSRFRVRSLSTTVLLLSAAGMTAVAWWALAGGSGGNAAAEAPLTWALRRGVAAVPGMGTDPAAARGGAGERELAGAPGEITEEEFAVIITRLEAYEREAAARGGQASPEYLAYLDSLVARMGVGPRILELLQAIGTTGPSGAGRRLEAAIYKALEDPASPRFRAELVGAGVELRPSSWPKVIAVLPCPADWYLTAGRAAPPAEYNALMGAAIDAVIRDALRRGRAHALVRTAPMEAVGNALRDYMATAPRTIQALDNTGTGGNTKQPVIQGSQAQFDAWIQLQSLMRALPPQADFAALDRMLLQAAESPVKAGLTGEEVAMARGGGLSSWAAADPGAALAYMSALPDGVSPDLASQLVAALFIRDRLDIASQLAAGLPPGPSRDHLNNVLKDALPGKEE